LDAEDFIRRVADINTGPGPFSDYIMKNKTRNNQHFLSNKFTSNIISSCDGGKPSRKSSRPSLTNFQFFVFILHGYFIRILSRYLFNR